ncbi:hypothetical protein [Verrucomicrobium sp. BvORR034]|uniref:DUF6891 domain-containing protein n=1 Tax=Verrucomicrobium sp. BvORR034 TaxID=1396418 RepID=UPI000678814F|nr:hypothetical protein [Verrucomicrobium sp. BvORR034]
MSEETAEALERIRHYVWTGFYQPEEIAEILCNDCFEPDTLDENWVLEQISSEIDRKLAEENSWKTPTDCDRLDQAFAELEKRNIIALQNAGYTQSDGIDDITEVWHDAGRGDSPIIGYCFYHGQDLERAIDGHGLMLTFGDILGTDDRGLEVGRTIKEVMEQHGFRTEWNGTIQQRINIPDIRWQKRTAIEHTSEA